MKSLHEQAKDLAEDASYIAEQTLSDKPEAIQLMEKLMYRYSVLRLNLIKEKQNA